MFTNIIKTFFVYCGFLLLTFCPPSFDCIHQGGEGRENDGGPEKQGDSWHLPGRVCLLCHLRGRV